MSNSATKPIESTVYAEKRAEQETSALSSQAQGAAQIVSDKAKATLDSATSIAGGYVTAVQDSLNNTTTTTSNPTPATGPTLVDTAKGAATLTAQTAQQYVTSAATTVQGYANAAQEKLAGAANQTSAAAENLQRDAAAHTNAAAAEGHSDVDAAKSATGSYVDQAKTVAATALSGAQSYVALGKEKLDGYTAANPPNTDTTLGSISATLQSAASTALNTTDQYLTSAQSSLKPAGANVKTDLESKGTTTGYAETAHEKAQPHFNEVKANTQPHIDAAKTTVQPQVKEVENALATDESKTIV